MFKAIISTVSFSFLLAITSFGQCAVNDLTLIPTDCNGDGNYDLIVNFNAQNPDNDFFDLFINDDFFAFYSLADLPITIENFPDEGFIVPFVGICINDNSDCCSVNEFEAPSCSNDCEVVITVLEAHDCDADGNFLVDFEIEYSGQGNDGFTVFGNGQNYGNFPYGQTFYTVGPFKGNGTSVYELIIQDV
ncbi:MAG: hypothetical protein ACI9XO_000016 [Paraglaciecola sp.]|jgi:hypothetical protein